MVGTSILGSWNSHWFSGDNPLMIQLSTTQGPSRPRFTRRSGVAWIAKGKRFNAKVLTSAGLMIHGVSMGVPGGNLLEKWKIIGYLSHKIRKCGAYGSHFGREKTATTGAYPMQILANSPCSWGFNHGLLVSSVQNPLSPHYTGWFIGIPLLDYCNSLYIG